MALLDAVAALKAALGHVRVYEFGAVPASPGYPYVVLNESLGAPIHRDVGGSGDLSEGLVVQVFSRSAESLRVHSRIVASEFDGKLMPGSSTVARLSVASPPFRDPDTAGVLGATFMFRF